MPVPVPVRLPPGASPGLIYDILCGLHDEGKERGAAPGRPVAGAEHTASTPNTEEVMPPGWEKVRYRGTVVYVDHVSREAHEEKPWEVWSRRAKA
ncbi:unnamed protein product [Phytomonas sp. EM1]|nr:unnamed protein product [Phytomonas sp. EM1]|eukprot:CCW63148.1 unnamed protein product [Phytomonas sp. isolate EM1]